LRIIAAAAAVEEVVATQREPKTKNRKLVAGAMNAF
jgi:hypothetical protein